MLARKPHALVIIDSPAFTLRVARYAHWFDRSIPIVDYVAGDEAAVRTLLDRLGDPDEIVAAVMASSQRLGLTKIGIVGSEQFIDE